METVKNEKEITGPLTTERSKAKERKEECFRKGLEILADLQAEQSLCDSGEEEEESDRYNRKEKELEDQRSKVKATGGM